MLPTDDPTLGKLFVAREKHKERVVLMRALERLEETGIRPVRTTFLDVGANVGTTVVAALQAGFESVVACEPVARSARLLRATLALNDVEERVRVVQAAVAGRDGTASIETKQGSRKARLVPGGGEQVRVASLDRLAADGVFDPAEIGFVLMDVEGYRGRSTDLLAVRLRD